MYNRICCTASLAAGRYLSCGISWVAVPLINQFFNHGEKREPLPECIERNISFPKQPNTIHNMCLIMASMIIWVVRIYSPFRVESVCKTYQVIYKENSVLWYYFWRTGLVQKHHVVLLWKSQMHNNKKSIDNSCFHSKGYTVARVTALFLSVLFWMATHC